MSLGQGLLLGAAIAFPMLKTPLLRMSKQQLATVNREPSTFILTSINKLSKVSSQFNAAPARPINTVKISLSDQTNL